MKKVNKSLTSILLILVASAVTLATNKKDSVAQAIKLQAKQNQYIAEYDFIEGMRESMLGNYQKSIFWFQRAIVSAGNSDEINYQLSISYLKINNLDKALASINQALKIDKSNKYYYLQKIAICEKKQNLNEIIRTYQLLIKNTKGGTAYLYDLANMFVYAEKDKEAIKAFNDFDKNFGYSEETAKQRMGLYLKKNNIKDAITENKKLVAAFPDNNENIISLAEILMIDKKYEDAYALAQNLLKKDSNNPYAFLILTDYYKQKNDNEEFKKYLRKAFGSAELNIDVKVGILINILRSSPNEESNQLLFELGDSLVKVHPYDAKSFAMNGDILTIAKDNIKALKNYKIATSLDNSNYKIWQQIILLDQEMNLNDSLIKDASSALELFPTNAIFWMYKGFGHQAKKDYKNSINSFEEGLNYSGKEKALTTQFRVLLADNYFNTKKYAKSDSLFEIVIAEDPKNYLALNNYSYYLSVRKEKLDYALLMSENVVKNNPENDTYVDTYAWILYEKKEYQKAKIEFDKIIENNKNGTIIEHYGDLLFQLNDIDGALKYWKKAKETGDTSDKIDLKIKNKKIYE